MVTAHLQLRLVRPLQHPSGLARPWLGDRQQNIIHSARVEGLGDQAILDATVRELAEYLPAAEHAPLRHARVHRVPMAIPAPHPGSGHLRPSAAAPIRNLHLAGDWTATGLPASMESAVRSGWLAAEQVLAADGRLLTLAEPLPAVEGMVKLVGYTRRGRTTYRRGGR